jgi:hypothetical protein
MVSRLPEATLRELAEAPVVGTLCNRIGVTRAAMARDLREGPAWFARNRVRAIVVQASFGGGPQQRYLEQVLPVAGRESLPDGAEILWLAENAGGVAGGR